VTKVEALIFDMDGVLVDSNPLHRVAWEQFNRRYGIATTEAMHQRMYGKRNDEIVRDFFGESLPAGEVAARGRDKESLYRELAAPRIEEMLVPGVREFLVRYHYLPKAVASNAEPDNVNFILDRAGLRAYFRAAVDGHQVERPKPYPDIYLRAADLLEVPAAGCVVFEDSHSGAAAALAAGMRVIGISTTHVNLPGSSITVDNFWSRELESWLEAQTRPV
jgi:beta-phosphoglucomutase family hydrolase